MKEEQLIRALGSAVIAMALTGGLFSVAEAKSHTVAAGETIASVAAREHVSEDQLTRLNDLDGTPALRAGTVLGLDEASVASLPAPSIADPAVRTQAAAELHDASTSNPSAGSDGAMWGESAADVRAQDLATVPTETPDAAAAASASPLHRLASRIFRRSSSIAVTLTKSAMQYIGTPYVFGGTSSSGFDCSGYVQHVFAEIGIRLPRTADAQYYAGATIHGSMVAGDLVFFQTYLPGPSHVGIYLGNGKFIASSGHGVRVDSLSESYWSRRYLGAKRFMKVPAASDAATSAF